MSAPTCDICSTDPPAWLYPAEQTHELFDPKGAWLVCGACHLLADANDWRGLRDRCVQTFVDRRGRRPSSRALHALRFAHKMFRETVTGPPDRLTGDDDA